MENIKQNSYVLPLKTYEDKTDILSQNSSV